MKNIKRKVQDVTVSTVGSIASTAHMSVILTGNLVKATTDMIGNQIANLEGATVSLIDNQRDPKEVAYLRKQDTNMKFAYMEHVLEEKNKKLRAIIEQQRAKVKVGVNNIQESLGLISSEENAREKALFRIGHLRETINATADDLTRPLSDRKADIRTMEAEIEKLNLQLETLAPVPLAAL